MRTIGSTSFHCTCVSSITQVFKSQNQYQRTIYQLFTSKCTFEIASRQLSDIKHKQFQIQFPLACVRIDVDDLKKINDEISHSAGDKVLKTIVTILRQKIRSRDKIYRLSGDEFTIILEDFSTSEAEGLMKRFADSLRKTGIKGKNIAGEDIEKTITVSIGISECNNHFEIIESFERADQAAIKSKKFGKDSIIVT